MFETEVYSLYREDAEGEFMPPLTKAEAIERDFGDGRTVPGIELTYDDGTVVAAAHETAKGSLVLMNMVNDQFYLMRVGAHSGLKGDLGVNVAALRAWLSVDIPLLDEDDEFARRMTVRNGMLTVEWPTHSASDPAHGRTGPVVAVWNGDALLGLRIRTNAIGTPISDHAERRRVNERCRLVRARMSGAWTVVKDECVRLGSTPRTDHKVGDVVKIGIQPVNPMPDDYNAEWMWVRITGVGQDGAALTGRLLNEPTVFAISLKLGDRVRFSNRDVFGGAPATA